MLRPLLVSLMLATAIPLSAMAETPRVAVDIPPVHGLVSMVMDGIGEPDLLLRPGASPHGYSMRPSEARALQNADIVIWIGPELTPWLDKPLAALSDSAQSLPLLDKSARVLEFRDTLDHAEEERHDDHGHEKNGHDDHGHAGHEGHDHHDHEGDDPHAWLDPVNARAWLPLIAEHLGRLDPKNAQAYSENAARADARLAELSSQAERLVAPMQGRKFVGFHDSLHYFEDRFGLTLAGTVALGDAQDPSPARLARLKEILAASDVACAFAEPQYDTGLLEVAIEEKDLRVFVMDPLGRDIGLGPDFYPNLILSVAQGFALCAAEE